MMKRLTEANIKTDPKISTKSRPAAHGQRRLGCHRHAGSTVLKEITMSLVLQRIEETREALVDALAERNWEAIGELDLACRSCMEDVMRRLAGRGALRDNLEELLGVYKQLLEAATGERQAIVDEMSQITQAQNAAKVYHLFG
jgi:hypothetical protein